jgi:hypothetical protein
LYKTVVDRVDVIMALFSKTMSIDGLDGVNGLHGVNGTGLRSNLEGLLNEARRDLLSQSGRILPDLNILLGAGEAALQGGLVDDRKYLVHALESLSSLEFSVTVFLCDRLNKSSNLPHLSPMAPSFVAASMRGLSTRCGRTCNIHLLPT